MEHDRLETFTRVWATRGTRRALLALLSVPPLSGWLTLWPEEATEAAGRRKRRKKHHHHQRGDAKENRQGKRKGQEKRQAKSPLASSTTASRLCAGVPGNHLWRSMCLRYQQLRATDRLWSL